MDFNPVIQRAKAILTSPNTEWPRIASEPASIGSLYRGYIMILAAFPALCGFVNNCFGVGLNLFGTERLDVKTGFAAAAIGYVATLFIIYILALIIDALAPSFGGQKNRVQALKTAAYSYTASWTASVGILIPFVGLFILLAGAIYGIYLLYLALPHTMKVPAGKAGGYTAVTVFVGVLLSWVVGIMVGSLVLGPTWEKRMEAAKQMQEQKQSATTAADTPAVPPAADSGYDANTAEDSADFHGVSLGRLREFAPEYLDGLRRDVINAQVNSADRLQLATVKATYRNERGRRLTLDIVDTAGVPVLLERAGWSNQDEERQTSTGYKRTYFAEGRSVREQWDHAHNSGEYGVVVGGRFVVRVQGYASSIDALKEAMREVDLGGLETLPSQ